MNIKLHKNPLIDFMTICFDIFVVILSYTISRFIMYPIAETNNTDMILLGCYCIITLIILSVYDFYTTQKRDIYEIVLSTAIVVVVVSLCMIMLSFILGIFFKISSNVFFVVMGIVMFSLFCINKYLNVKFIKFIEGKPKLLVVEAKKDNNALARKIKYSYVKLYQSWYIQVNVNDEDEIQRLLDKEFREYESIFICPCIPGELRERLIAEAVNSEKDIFVLPDLYNINFTKKDIVVFDDTPSIRIRPFELTSFQKFNKRILDLVISLIGILITLPLMVIIAISIKLDSNGPIFYCQERLTVNKKAFQIYKFRTMVANAEDLTGPTLASENDSRITGVGKILRSLRFDELPQLFNVLFGSMSIVGPRPERPVFVEQYCKEMESYHKRFLTKAGITGQAQVYGRYDTSAVDKILYDLLYISDYSLWLDIKLILLTIKTIFIKQSSEGIKQQKVYQKISSV